MLRTILHFQVTLQNPGNYYIPYQPALLKRWFPFPLWWDTLVSGNLPQHLPVNVEATLSGIEGLLQDSVGVGILFEALATLKWWFLKWCSSNLLVTWLRYLLSNYQCSPHFPLNCWRYVVGSRVSLLCQTVVSDCYFLILLQNHGTKYTSFETPLLLMTVQYDPMKNQGFWCKSLTKLIKCHVHKILKIRQWRWPELHMMVLHW